MFILSPISAVLADRVAATAVLGYLDPGAGSMLLQVLVAGLFSSMFFAKSSYSYMREVLLSKKKKI